MDYSTPLISLASIIGASKLLVLNGVLIWLGRLVIRRVVEPDGRSFLTKLFIAALVLRLLFGLFLFKGIPHLVHEGNLSFGYLNDDGILYEDLGWKGLEAIKAGRDPLRVYRTGAVGYIFMITTLYGIVGREVFAIQSVNSLMGALVPIFMYQIGRTFLTVPQARAVAVLTALYPEQIVYSGSQQKDISITLFLIVGVWVISRLADTVNFRQQRGLYLLLLACSAYLTVSRFYYTPVLIFALALHFRRELFHRFSMRQILVGGAAMATLGILMFVMFTTVLTRQSSLLTNPIQGIANAFNSFAVRSVESNSFYNLLRPPLNIILFPITILFVLLNPFILWPFINPQPIYYVLLPAIISWYILLPFIVYGFFGVRKLGFGNSIYWIVLATFAILIVTGSGVIAIGRTKLPIQPFLLIFALLGWEAFARAKLVVRFMVGGYATGIIGVILLYVIVKLRIPPTVMALFFIPDLFLVAVLYLALRQRALAESRSKH